MLAGAFRALVRALGNHDRGERLQRRKRAVSPSGSEPDDNNEDNNGESSEDDESLGPRTSAEMRTVWGGCGGEQVGGAGAMVAVQAGRATGSGPKERLKRRRHPVLSTEVKLMLCPGVLQPNATEVRLGRGAGSD
jgi:hypothetical protein